MSRIPELDFINTELTLARTMLRIADTEMAVPADPDSAARVINHARAALQAARDAAGRLLPRMNQMERVSIHHALVDLQGELETRHTEKPNTDPE